MRNKIYFHIGLQKTATTTLQTDIFPKIPNVKFMGRNDKAAVNHELYHDICRYCFSIDKDYDLKLEISKRIEMELSENNLLFSEEWFCTDYDNLYKGSGDCWQHKLRSLGECLFGFEYEIIISSRKPIDALFSVYCQNLQRYSSMEYGTFQQFYQSSNDAKAYNSKYLKEVVDVELRERKKIHEIKFENINNLELVNKSLTEIFGLDCNGVEVLSNNNVTKLYKEDTVTIKKDTAYVEFVRHVSRLLPETVKIWIKQNFSINVNSLVGEFRKSEIIKRPTQRDVEFIKEMYGETNVF